MTEKNLLKQLSGKPGIKKVETGKFNKTNTFVEGTVVEETEQTDDESLKTD